MTSNGSTTQKRFEYRRVGAVDPGVAYLLEEILEFPDLLVRAENASQNFGNVATGVAVLEQADVMFRSQGVQELVKGSWSFWEIEHVQALVRHIGDATHQVPNMALGKLVPGEVGDGKVAILWAADRVDAVQEALQLLCPLRCRRRQAQAEEHVGARGGSVPIAELGDGMGKDGTDELGERPWLLGNVAGQQHLLARADVSSLGYEAEAVEIHICTTGDGNERPGRVARGVGGDPLLQAGHGQSTSGLDNRPRVLEDVLDGGASLVGGDQDDLIDDLLADAECLLANLLDSGAVCKQADLVEHDPLPLGERPRQGVGIMRLDTNDLDMRGDALDVNTDAGQEAASADAAEDGLKLLQVCLAEQLHTDGALASDDIGVVERRDVDEAVLLFPPCTLLLGGVEVGAVQDDVATHA